MPTTLSLQQVEQLIYRCRSRQLHAEQFGTATAAKTYRERCDYWLELWPAAKTDRHVSV